MVETIRVIKIKRKTINLKKEINYIRLNINKLKTKKIEIRTNQGLKTKRQRNDLKNCSERKIISRSLKVYEAAIKRLVKKNSGRNEKQKC